MLPRIPTTPPADREPTGGESAAGQFIGHIWRSLYYVYIVASLEIGIVLLFLPWRSQWENNYLLYLYPQFLPILSNYYFKGFVSGLGIINLLIGIQEVGKLWQSWKIRHPSS